MFIKVFKYKRPSLVERKIFLLYEYMHMFSNLMFCNVFVYNILIMFFQLKNGKHLSFRKFKILFGCAN